MRQKKNTTILASQKYRKGRRVERGSLQQHSLLYSPKSDCLKAEAENCTGTGKSRSGEMELSWCQHMKLQLHFSGSETQGNMLSECIVNAVLSSLMCSRYPKLLLDSKECHLARTKQQVSSLVLPVPFLSLGESVSCSLWRASVAVFSQEIFSWGPPDQTVFVEACCNLFATKLY